MKKNIILIGMPGAGKSTVGVVLAKALGLQFADTDLLIQGKAGKTLQSIIDNEGIEAFLKTEEEVLSSLSLQGFVIATGGSAVLSHKAMIKLKENGVAVFLDLPIEEIKKRVNNITTRGIAMDKGDSLDKVFNTRLPLYGKYADITVCTQALTLEETVGKILKELQ